MPRSFLTQKDIEELQSFPESISHNDLITFFTLIDSDLAEIRLKKTVNQLAFAIYLCALRYMGYFPKEIERTPDVIIRFLTEQLELPESIELGNYTQRSQTQSTHHRMVEQYLGFSAIDETYKNKLQTWMMKRALEHDSPSFLFRLTADKLKQDRKTRLGLRKMEVIVSQARASARQETYNSLKVYLDERTRNALDQLLVSESPTSLSWLIKKTTTHSPESILNILSKIRTIRDLGTQDWLFSTINRNRIKQLVRQGKKSTNQALQRSKPERRYTILMATLSELLHECTDECIEVFDLSLSSILRKSKNNYEEVRMKQDKQINRHNIFLQKIAELIVDPNIPDQMLRESILKTIPENALKEIIEDPQGLIRPADGNHLDYIIKRFSYIRQYSPKLLATLKFHCQPNKKLLLNGIDVLKNMNVSKHRKVPTSAPMDFIHPVWYNRIEQEEGQARRYYELAVLWELRSALRSGEVWVEDSRKYQAVESYLIPRDKWKSIKKEAEKLLNLPQISSNRIKERCDELNKCYSHLNKILPDEKVKITEGNLSISPTAAEDEPESVKELKRLITERLPRIELTDLLVEVDSWTKFSKALTHSGVQNPTPKTDLTIYKYASLMAQATNIGISQMADSADLSYQRLLWCTNWYINDETLDMATVEIINFHHSHWLTKFWGDGTFSSSDGQRFPAAVKTNTARPLPKYFAYSKGLNFYSWTSDQFSQYGSDVPTSLEEAPYVLDAILDNVTDLDIKRHTTDTAGYTEIMFALFDLVGLRFEPRIKNLGSQRIYRTSEFRDLKKLKDLEVFSINTDLITRLWDDLVRNAASMKMGWVTASLLINKYQKTKRQSELIKALQEYGKIIKSISILRYAGNEKYRREIGTQLNKGECLHNLRQFILFAREGKIFKRTHEKQIHQAKSLNLVTNAVVLWNTVYMGRVIEQLQREGIKIDLADLEHISPARFDHINPYGKFKFEVNKLIGRFRELRSPNTHS